ncbi:MAG TPA: hypothetical protein PKO09_18270 [Anaerolineae bacterium]|nr:hypothetical protein [Anaerolineae bacterium]
MPSLPPAFWTGPINYWTILTAVLQDEPTRERLRGEMCYEPLSISLADGEGQTQYASSFHESLHAFAYALFGFLHDNSALFPAGQDLWPLPPDPTS